MRRRNPRPLCYLKPGGDQFLTSFWRVVFVYHVCLVRISASPFPLNLSLFFSFDATRIVVIHSTPGLLFPFFLILRHGYLLEEVRWHLFPYIDDPCSGTRTDSGTVL